MAGEVAFELRNVQVGLGSRVVLQQMNLSTPIGSVIGLVRRSGAGKSALLRLLADHGARYTGEASVFGRKLPGAASGAVYLAAEHWPFRGDQRLRDLTRHVARVHPNFDVKRAIELLAWSDAPKDRHPMTLNRGQRTATFLSLTLMARAPLTLLDELYNDLDMPTRQRFARVLLEELHMFPCTLLISTHLVDEAKPLFRYVVLIESDRIIAADTVGGLVTSFTRVNGPMVEVDALPRLGRLDRGGVWASAIVRKEAEGDLLAKPVSLREPADLLIGPRHDTQVDVERRR